LIIYIYDLLPYAACIASKQLKGSDIPQIFHVQFKRCANGEVYGFFGVFDGHGGAMAANFVKDNLFVNLEKHEKFPDDMDAALSVISHVYLGRCYHRHCCSTCTYKSFNAVLHAI
jgi:hypothetical protein